MFNAGMFGLVRRWRDWRVVGSLPTLCSFEDRHLGVECVERYFVICYSTGRLGVGYTFDSKIEVGDYVIVEADRGEDLGSVSVELEKAEYSALLKTEKRQEVSAKLIHRRVYIMDYSCMHAKKTLEKKALTICIEMAKHLKMNIFDCEYQWDMNKITFYYSSEKKIDFRELVKQLHKEFKIRIWMCSVDRNKTNLLSKYIR